MESTVILGAGISGLSFYDSYRNKSEAIVIDKNIELGGFTRTINIDRFKFVYTGHFLHINKFEHPADIGKNGNKFRSKWDYIKKRSKVFIDKKFCNAPYQYNFGQISKKHALEAIKSFEERKKLKNKKSLGSFMQSQFGDYMCDKFFIPYNEKIFCKSLRELSSKQVSRFFPIPDENLIRNQISSQHLIQKKTYNSYFWYPKDGGIDLLLRHFEQPKNKLTTKPIKINPFKKTITLLDGSELIYKNLISSIPLNELINTLENNSDFDDLNLTFSSQYVVHIGTRQSIKVLNDNAWIYIPDPLTKIYRIGNYAFASPLMKSSEDGLALYIELSGNCKNPIKESIQYLRENFGLDENLIEVTTLNKLSPGYVHFNMEQEEKLEKALSNLRDLSIYSIGRYGSWDYVSMEDCIIRANALAKDLE